MRQLAERAKTDWEIRSLAVAITQGLRGKDYRSEAIAIYHWVTRNVRYVRDIHKVELVQSPTVVLRTRAGDCDDMSSLIAALCLSIGMPVRFVTAGFHTHGPHSHVFPQALVGPGAWITLDPVAGVRTREMMGRIRTLSAYY